MIRKNSSIIYFYILYFFLLYSSDTAVQFQDFVYLSQVVQALCIKAEAEHYRRYISVDDVFTRGTLYWQLVRALMYVHYTCMYSTSHIVSIHALA